ncbi:hypothetical protein TNIN_47161 [Trichonephila inaurata madagascariensis]|uniref:Uncharacterized protein n=1 Tax=Trichonephila inaurata madagascariensis TaxID=2747483 RepID=A0A8X7CFG5_9ARAC|nr:hypothetical protein TNIN_47161 [Trichonephila inaurata madagascariensis]
MGAPNIARPKEGVCVAYKGKSLRGRRPYFVRVRCTRRNISPLCEPLKLLFLCAWPSRVFWRPLPVVWLECFARVSYLLFYHPDLFVESRRISEAKRYLFPGYLSLLPGAQRNAYVNFVYMCGARKNEEERNIPKHSFRLNPVDSNPMSKLIYNEYH